MRWSRNRHNERRPTEKWNKNETHVLNAYAYRWHWLLCVLAITAAAIILYMIFSSPPSSISPFFFYSRFWAFAIMFGVFHMCVVGAAFNVFRTHDVCQCFWCRTRARARQLTRVPVYQWQYNKRHDPMAPSLLSDMRHRQGELHYNVIVHWIDQIIFLSRSLSFFLVLSCVYTTG